MAEQQRGPPSFDGQKSACGMSPATHRAISHPTTSPRTSTPPTLRPSPASPEKSTKTIANVKIQLQKILHNNFFSSSLHYSAY